MRILDLIFSFFGLIVLSPILIIVFLLGFIDSNSPIFIQERVGRNKKPFKLFKFRTMPVKTKSVASHLVDNRSITFYGSILRKTKLDELPQLWNVLTGDMSLVGPRPNLFNQSDLIHFRDSLGVYSVRPGVTGLAQITNIDMSTPKLLAETDSKMIKSMTFKFYFKLITLTILGNGSGDATNKR